MLTGVVGTIVAIDAETVAETATVASDWIGATSGFAFTIFYKQNSAGGTPSVSVIVEVSPYQAKYLNDLVAAGTDTVAYYVAATLASTVTTENTIIRYTNSILDSPFQSIRVKVTGDGSNPTDTVATVMISRFE